MTGIFSPPNKITMIELTPIKHMPKQWMRDVMRLPLHKKAIDTFLESLAEVCKHHVTKEVNWPEAFQNLFLPFLNNSISYFKPSDDLLYRLKFMTLVSANQMSRTLYIAMLKQRVLCGYNMSLPAPLRMVQIAADEQLNDMFNQRMLKMDDEINAKIHNNPGIAKYIRNLEIFSGKLKEFLELFAMYQSDCGVQVVLIRLGEFLHKVLPNISDEEIKRQLSIFTWNMRQHRITEGTGITLARRAMQDLNTHQMANIELNVYVEQVSPIQTSVADMRMGIEGILCLVDYSKLAQDTTNEVENTGRFRDFILNDLLPNTERRKALERAISAVEKYASDKLQLNERVKSSAARDLVSGLRNEAMEYFSCPLKTPEKLAEFKEKCQAAIAEANAVIAVHTSSDWQLVLQKLGAAILTIATGGIALAVSQTCRATLFSNQTQGARAIEQVTATLSSRI
jgi:hypothetical protein